MPVGGNKAKRAKGPAQNAKRELKFKERGEEYGQVVRMLGDARCEVTCSDGTKRLCHIRGKMIKKVWICLGDTVLVSLRHFHFKDMKGDIIVKYNFEEVRNLKAYGELPAGYNINETDVVDSELSKDKVSQLPNMRSSDVDSSDVDSVHSNPSSFHHFPRSMRPNWEAKPASPKPPEHREGSGELRQVDPSLVRFTQSSISPVFRNLCPIEKTIVNIMRGRLDFSDIEIIRCTEQDGKVYSLDNRRLYVARVLHTMGVIESIWVVLVPFDHPVHVQRVVDGQTIWQRKYTTTNRGQWVKVNGRYFNKERDELVSCFSTHRRFHVRWLSPLQTSKRTKPREPLRIPLRGRALFFGSEFLNEDLSERFY
jgi:translation initiation factor 1A